MQALRREANPVTTRSVPVAIYTRVSTINQWGAGETGGGHRVARPFDHRNTRRRSSGPWISAPTKREGPRYPPQATLGEANRPGFSAQHTSGGRETKLYSQLYG